MATVLEKQKIKKQCIECKKSKPSYWFDNNATCKMCLPNSTTYVCTSCEETIPYHKMLFNRGNVQKRCKNCDGSSSKERYDGNSKHRIRVVGEYRKKNLDKITSYKKEWDVKNHEYLREYQQWYNSQPHIKITNSLRCRLYGVLQAKKKKKTIHTFSLLGCDLAFFIEWMEFQYMPGMTLKNHGEWHMDHCKPCNAFDLMDESEQSICFHWTNIQPLWGPDNIAKSDRYSIKDLLFQEIKVAAFKFKKYGTIRHATADMNDRSLLLPPTSCKRSYGTSGKLDKTFIVPIIITRDGNLLTITEPGKEIIVVEDDMIGAW